MDAHEQQRKCIQAYDLYADAIFRHCYFRISDRELAQDLMQETFTRTWEYMVEKGSIDNIRAFLYRTANNLIIDHFRKKKEVSLEQKMEEGFQPVAPYAGIKESIDAGGVLDLLSRLTLEYREIIIMRYIDEMSPKEIAEVLGESANVVSVRLNRATQKLRTFLPKEPLKNYV